MEPSARWIQVLVGEPMEAVTRQPNLVEELVGLPVSLELEAQLFVLPKLQFEPHFQ